MQAVETMRSELAEPTGTQCALRHGICDVFPLPQWANFSFTLRRMLFSFFHFFFCIDGHKLRCRPFQPRCCVCPGWLSVQFVSWLAWYLEVYNVYGDLAYGFDICTSDGDEISRGESREVRGWEPLLTMHHERYSEESSTTEV